MLGWTATRNSGSFADTESGMIKLDGLVLGNKEGNEGERSSSAIVSSNKGLPSGSVTQDPESNRAISKPPGNHGNG